MILKIRDKNGNVQEVPVIKGDKGEDGKDYVLTLADKKEIANMANGDIDQTYNPESENAQSGKAVAEGLTDYVKNTDYATNNKAGVVKVSSSLGIGCGYASTGILNIMSATNEEIDKGKQLYKPIVPANLEYAVNSVLKKEYELINTITVSPDTDGSLPQYVNFTLDKDGKPFELTDFFIKGYAGFTDGNKSTLYMKVNNVNVISNNLISSISSNTNRTFMIYYRRENDGFIRMEVSSSVQGNVYYNAQILNDVSRLLPLQFHPQLSETVNNISIYTLLGDNKTWIDGSTFELWGVRK